MRFVDEATILVRAGKGGHGAVSFRREKFVPRGGPDGGDGGRGGDVWLRASDKLLTLYDFRHKRVHEARNGMYGTGAQRNGKAGDDLIVDVPVGTLVYLVEEILPRETPVEPEAEADVPWRRDETGAYVWGDELDELEETAPAAASDAEDETDAFDDEDAGNEENAEDDEDDRDETDAGHAAPDESSRSRLLADLSEPGQMVRIAKGGRGGKGNAHFKSSTMRAPRFAQPGEPGQEMRLRLELKILADVGLLGLPNAGKSTFLSAVSAARPKVAPYPFTTLSPNLGVVADDWGRRMVVADIPGLVEGAHAGLGLGHRFLKHVERTRFLVHLLSAEEVGQESPWAGFELLNDELVKFAEALGTKEQIEVINKIDLLSPEDLAALRERARTEGRNVRFISALTGEGVEELVQEMWRRFTERDSAA